MIEKIKMTKDKVLDFMDQEVGKYGGSRMDVKEVGELADIIKDLAEAEYYCTVAEAMTGGSQESVGYGGGMGRMGYNGGGQGGGSGSGGGMGGGGGRSGYGSNMMSHNDPMSAIRDIMATADPETKMMLRSEINKMM